MPPAEWRLWPGPQVVKSFSFLEMLHLNALIRSRIVRSFNDGDDELAFLSSAIPEERFRERDMVRLHIFRFLIEQQRVLFEESFIDILVIRTDAWYVVEQVEIQS